MVVEDDDAVEAIVLGHIRGGSRGLAFDTAEDVGWRAFLWVAEWVAFRRCYLAVEVQVDDGPWGTATMDKSNTQYSWKLFTYNWEGATPGEHTLVSRVTDTKGNIQPTVAELAARKKTFLEDNAQFPRKVKIS